MFFSGHPVESIYICAYTYINIYIYIYTHTHNTDIYILYGAAKALRDKNR